jgi:hypothetical protein
MAKAILSSVLAGLRGRIDGMVFRQQAGQTVVTPRPKVSGRASTPAQLAARERFSRAAAFGRSVVADPALRALYAEGPGDHRSAYVAALTDALRAPVIDALETTAFRGAVGDAIVIRARDDHAVTAVSVAVKDAAGVVLEQGPANAADGAWRYAMTRSVATGSTITVEATAKDRPGNATTFTRPVTV